MRRSSLYPEQQLQRRALSWAVQLRVNPERVVVARMSSKWGSCAPDGVVTFADDLAEMGDSFQDYVIVHELLHLRYRNHGKLFTALMTAHVPNWREMEQLVGHGAPPRSLEDRRVRGGNGRPDGSTAS